MLAALPQAQQTKLKQTISKHVQQYYLNLSNSALPTASLQTSEDQASQISLNSEIPAMNFGIPIVIVGCKGDFFPRKSTKIGPSDRFDFITRRLRKFALQYGSGLVYTSSVGKGTNIDLLQSYIFHRLYSFPFNAPQKVVGSDDDWSIHVPSGFDSQDLIDTSFTASRSGWTDSTPFEEVFTNPSRTRQTKQSSGVSETVKAQDNMLFFKNLKFQLEQGPNLDLLKAARPQHQSSKSVSSSSSSPSLASLPPPSPSSSGAASVSSTGSVGGASPSAGLVSSSSSAQAAVALTNLKTGKKTNSKDMPNIKEIAVKQFFRSLLNNNTSGTGAPQPGQAQPNQQKLPPTSPSPVSKKESKPDS